MIAALFNQPNYQAARAMMDATALRQEAIQSNIANLETPGYKRLDLAPNFETQLKTAVSSGDISQISGLKASIEVDANAKAANRDGNSVNLEEELLALNQNTLSHTVETQMITGTLLKLRMAITGRPS